MLKYRVANVGGEAFEGFHADKGVAVAVEFGTPDGDGEIAGDVGCDASAYTAFTGHAGTECEVARFVVETTGEHQCAQTLCLAAGEHLFATERIQATIAQKEECPRQVDAGHGNGTLVAVNVDESVYVIPDIAEAFHEISQCHVAVGIGTLGAGDFFVVINVVVVAKPAYKFQDGIFRMGIERYEAVGHNQCACVDERIARFAMLVFQLHKGIEGIAGRLAPYGLPNFIANMTGHHRQGKNFRDTLYGKTGFCIACLIILPIQCGKRNAELPRIHFCQGGNVVRHFPLSPQSLQFAVYFFYYCLIVHIILD